AFGTPGTGTSMHLAGVMFDQLTGAGMQHIPYKGSAQALNDLLGGHLPIMFDNLPASLPHIKSGKVHALAVTGSKRAPALPDVPTLAEAGVAGADAATWYSLAAPAGTPADIVRTLSDTVRAVNDDPDYRRVMREQAIELMALSPQEEDAYVAKDQADMRRLLGALGLLAK
uniref:tripartite tricarboxylate transporter substrate-binding protein n=1 Tax=Escherichia coli TaxID=562 RepID=UPI0023B8E90B